MKAKKPKKILVTGGLGFIGSNLVDALVKHGHKVVIIDRSQPGFFKPLNLKAKHYKLDCNSPEVAKVFKKEKPEVVMHLAANISVPRSVSDPVYDATNNIIGALRLLEIAERYGTKRFVFASSGGAIYGDYPVFPTPELRSLKPLSPYGISKQAFEYYLFHFVKEHGLSTMVLRMSNVYGPRQGLGGESGVVGIFCKKIVLGEPIDVYNKGKETRDFLYVEDAVEAFHKAIDSSANGFVNISSGQEIKIKKLVEIIGKTAGVKLKLNYLPPRSQGEIVRSVLDNRLAKKELGWFPKTSLEQGIKKTFAWYESNREELFKKSDKNS